MKKTVFSLVGLLMAAIVMGQIPFKTDNILTKSGKELQISFIKHASLIMSFEGKVVYIDPVSEFADFSKLPKADVILITHEHSDHLDKEAIRAIEKQGTVIVANSASAKILGRGEVMSNGDKLQPVKWLSLEAVPAYNTTEGRQQYHPHNGRDNGYVMTIGGSRVFVAGDAENIPEFKELKNITVAFIPVNQPYTMTVDQAVEAAKAIAPEILYPYHYGDTKIDEVVKGLESNPEIDVRIRNLE